MEWSKRMNSAVDYIEDNLDSEIDINEAAKKAHCASFHFQRTFYSVIGITPAEYIKRRRLAIAAGELASGNVQVIDVALKYGYNSPNAFTRAFRKMHGINPGQAHKPSVKFAEFPRVSFYIELKGGSDSMLNQKKEAINKNNSDYRLMDYSIREIRNTRLVGKIFRNLHQNVNWDLFWKKATKDGFLDNLEKNYMKNTDNFNGAIVCSYMNPSSPDGWTDFFIGYESDKYDLPDEHSELKLPSGSYAVFKSNDLQSTWKKITTGGFRTSQYIINGPSLEIYPKNQPGYGEIWLSVTENKSDKKLVDYYIKEVKQIRLIGKKYKNIPSYINWDLFWGKVREEGYLPVLAKNYADKQAHLKGAMVCAYMEPTDSDGYQDLFIGYESDSKNLKKGIEELKIPSRSYAVFKSSLMNLPSSWRQIYSEWFPNTDYIQHGASLEVYPADAYYAAEIWMPVKLRKS